jgi:hypothetical protein
VIYEGTDPVTGKERRSWHPAGRDRADAERLAARLANERDGANDEARSLSFGAFLSSRWLPGKRLVLAASTHNGYRNNVENHIIPALGHVRLRRLRPDHLDAFYDRLLHPRNGDSPLAPKTVYEIHLVIRGALEEAVRRGLVSRNVALVAHAPRLRSIPRVERRSWTPEELRTFLCAAAGHRLFAALWTAAFTGMRRNELLGLRWQDFDEKAATISINRGLVAIDYEVHEREARLPGLVGGSTWTRPRWASSPRGASGNGPSSALPASKGPGGCSPTAVASPSIPTPSRRPSSASPDAPVCPSSGFTSCVTLTARCSSQPAFRSRS